MRKRNHCIDTIKGIACIAVVVIHYNWGEEFSTALKTISRFAVPFFFFVSGFYLPDSQGVITTAALQRKTKHIFRMLVNCAVFYGLFCIFWNLAMEPGWNILAYIRGLITPWKICNMVISGNPLVYAHFWYLLCSFYCYLVLFPVHKKAGDTFYKVAFVVFLAVYTLFAEFQKYFGLRNYVSFGEGCNLVISNISLLRSMPFFLWGICLRKSVGLTQKDSGEEKKPGIRFGILAAVAVAGCVLAVIEERIYGTILMYVGSNIAVVCFSLMAVWYPEKRIGVLEYIGNSLSMQVYIYHIAVGKLWDLFATKANLWENSIFSILRPALVLVSTLVAAQLIVWAKNNKERIFAGKQLS